MDGYNYNGNLQVPINIRDPYFPKQDNPMRGRTDEPGIYFSPLNIHGAFPRPKRDASHDHHIGGVKYMKIPSANGFPMTISESHEMHNSMDPELKYLLAPEIILKYTCQRCSEVLGDLASFENHMVTLHSQHQSIPTYEAHRALINQVPSMNSIPQSPHITHPVTTYQTLRNIPPVHQMHSHHMISSPVTVPTTHATSAITCIPAIRERTYTIHENNGDPTLPEEEPSSPKLSYNCLKCIDSFSSNEQLASHVFKIHAGKYKCKECSYTFHEQTKLADHIAATHMMLKPFQCIECESKFTQKYSLKEHVEFCHRNKLIDCDDCGISFPHKSALRSHVKAKHTVVKSFHCPHCFEPFNRKKDMKVHLEEFHNGSSITEPTKSRSVVTKMGKGKTRGRKTKSQKPFKCKECKTSFARKKALQIHKEDVHAEDEFEDNIKCPHCEFTSFHSKTITSHILEKHLIKSFDCTECNSKFSTKSSFDQHKCKTHTDRSSLSKKTTELKSNFLLSKKEDPKHPLPTRHSCTKCGESFRIRRKLLSHTCAELLDKVVEPIKSQLDLVEDPKTVSLNEESLQLSSSLENSVTPLGTVSAEVIHDDLINVPILIAASSQQQIATFSQEEARTVDHCDAKEDHTFLSTSQEPLETGSDTDAKGTDISASDS